jgi:xanthine dehydrogenase accessory factor
MNPIPETAARLLAHHRAFALATILSRQGSTPRTAGTRMIICENGRTIGTIGGGAVEARVIRKADEVLATQRPALLTFDMTPSDLAAMDMICGGQLEVLLEFIGPGGPAATIFKGWQNIHPSPEPRLYLTMLHVAGGKVEGIEHALLEDRRVLFGDLTLDRAIIAQLIRDHSDVVGLHAVTFDDALILVEPILPVETVLLIGAGHVAQPTAMLAKLVGFHVQVVDDRPEFANAERFPEAEEIRVVPNFNAALEGGVVGPGSFIVIVTRGHLHDQTVLGQALATDAGYIGMIGSRRKRDHIYRALREQGFSQADLERVHCPIGLDIAAETPEEIALSIVAELVMVRARRRRP